ncbi:MAG: hypothetical protein U9N61_02285 [Euryarchaeota archaeon]|nr:hypothetical protein [Euryarchaeota archaeon]
MGEGKKKSKSKKLRFERLEHNGNKIELKKPITVEIQKYGEGYALAYEEFGILSIGETIEECKEFFQEEFFVLMDMYLVKDEELTTKAIKLKRKIEAILKH